MINFKKFEENNDNIKILKKEIESFSYEIILLKKENKKLEKKAKNYDLLEEEINNLKDKIINCEKEKIKLDENIKKMEEMINDKDKIKYDINTEIKNTENNILKETNLYKNNINLFLIPYNQKTKILEDKIKEKEIKWNSIVTLKDTMEINKKLDARNFIKKYDNQINNLNDIKSELNEKNKNIDKLINESKNKFLNKIKEIKNKNEELKKKKLNLIKVKKNYLNKLNEINSPNSNKDLLNNIENLSNKLNLKYNNYENNKNTLIELKNIINQMKSLI